MIINSGMIKYLTLEIGFKWKPCCRKINKYSKLQGQNLCLALGY